MLLPLITRVPHRFPALAMLSVSCTVLEKLPVYDIIHRVSLAAHLYKHVIFVGLSILIRQSGKESCPTVHGRAGEFMKPCMVRKQFMRTFQIHLHSGGVPPNGPERLK